VASPPRLSNGEESKKNFILKSNYASGISGAFFLFTAEKGALGVYAEI
jgi:hypothetical protein